MYKIYSDHLASSLSAFGTCQFKLTTSSLLTSFLPPCLCDLDQGFLCDHWFGTVSKSLMITAMGIQPKIETSHYLLLASNYSLEDRTHDVSKSLMSTAMGIQLMIATFNYLFLASNYSLEDGTHELLSHSWVYIDRANNFSVMNGTQELLPRP